MKCRWPKRAIALGDGSVRDRRKPLVTTVLICDDHRRFREHLRRYVAAVPGVDRVMTADTSAETFVRYAAELPALVLLDVAMPELGGPETARLLVAAHPGANVVMLAGNADSDNLARAMAGGARHRAGEIVTVGIAGEHDDVRARVGCDKKPGGLRSAEFGHRDVKQDEGREFGGVAHERLGAGVRGHHAVDAGHRGDITAQ